jgi:hypothetical protein
MLYNLSTRIQRSVRSIRKHVATNLLTTSGTTEYHKEFLLPKPVETLPPTLDFDWPVLENKKFNRHLRKWMYSFKNVYSENINLSNLMFVTGPTKSGKSWFLKRNLQEFIKQPQESKNGRVLFHMDL